MTRHGLLLHPPRKRQTLPDLPTFDGGEPLVDMADRNALYDAMGASSARRFLEVINPLRP